MLMLGDNWGQMANNRRVSFVTQQPARWSEDGDGHGLLVVRPQSVFHRLGPKVGMYDPPYVPVSVGEPPLPGMIFGCTNETYAECMERELFGLPIINKPQVMRIAPGASLFLFNFRTKRLHGIFEATCHGGVHVVRDAFDGKFPAQVKFRVAEECPALDELEFKEVILANYIDARKFKFFLNGAQVCRLKTLFREKAVHAWAVSEGIVSRRSAQLRLLDEQHSGDTMQVQRRVINSASNYEAEGSRRLLISVPPVLPRLHAPPSHIRSRSPQGLEVSIRGRVPIDEVERSRTVLRTAPPILSRVQATPSHIRSRSPKGLEVSISSKDNKRNGAPDSPRRHVVMYEARKEQKAAPVVRSKIIRPVKEVVHARSGRGTPQDRKRCADSSPHGRLLFQEQGPELGEIRPGKSCTDLRELLTRPNLKRLKSSTKASAQRLLSKPMGPPVDPGGKITKSNVLSDVIVKKELERGPSFASKKRSAISLGPQNAEISKDLATPKRAGSVQESRKIAKTIGSGKGVHGNLKKATVGAGDRMQSLTVSGSHDVKPKPMVVGTKGREVTDACRSGSSFNSSNLKMADGDGVGSRAHLSTSSPVKSEVLPNSNLSDVNMEVGLGDQSKDGGLDIYVSLTVEEAKIASQTDSGIVSDKQRGIEGVVRCILGKRPRESNEQEPTLNSSMAAQALKAERSAQQQEEGPKDGHAENPFPNAPSSLAHVFETLQERENATPVASAEEKYLTSEAQSVNGSCKKENLSEREKPLDHGALIPTNAVPLNDAIPVVGTIITGSSGDIGPRDCKRHRVEENGVSSPVHKLNKVGQNDAGCSYLTLTGEGDMREKVSQKQGVDCKMPLQILPSSLKSGNPWNSRTLRYGRPRSANHANISFKSGCEPSRVSDKSELNVVSVKIEEETVDSDGEDCERQLESSNGTEISRTIGGLRTQHPLLVCELGNPGGLPLDGKMIKVDTLDESPRDDQPGGAADVAQEPILPAETDSTTRLERVLNTQPSPRSNELNTIGFREKEIATAKGLTVDESQVAGKICHSIDLYSKEITQPAMIACNGGSAHPSLPSCTPHGANVPQGAKIPVGDDIQHCLDATRGFPPACTSSASLSNGSGALGEAKLEINIPIKEEGLEINIPIEEEELEICLPIEEEEVDAVPEDQIRRLWGSSNRDITPWKLLQKNPS